MIVLGKLIFFDDGVPRDVVGRTANTRGGLVDHPLGDRRRGPADPSRPWLDRCNNGRRYRPPAVDILVLPFFTHTVTVPALRHRIEDLEELVLMLLRELTRGAALRLAPEAMRQSNKLPWPGNAFTSGRPSDRRIGRRCRWPCTARPRCARCRTTGRGRRPRRRARAPSVRCPVGTSSGISGSQRNGCSRRTPNRIRLWVPGSAADGTTMAMAPPAFTASPSACVCVVVVTDELVAVRPYVSQSSKSTRLTSSTSTTAVHRFKTTSSGSPSGPTLWRSISAAGPSGCRLKYCTVSWPAR